MELEVLLFARFRERLGWSSRTFQPDVPVQTVADLCAWLAAQDPAASDLFSPGQPVMAAINDELASLDDTLSSGDRVALFPPVTGG